MKYLAIRNHTKFASIDDEDFERVSKYTWHVSGSGRSISRNTTINGKNINIALASEVMCKTHLVYDHIDRDMFNNQKENLRETNDSTNNFNKEKRKGSYHSRFKGVSFKKITGKWTAHIQFCYKQRQLGSFKTEKEAASAYNKEALKLVGEFAVLNKDESGNIL